MRDGTVVWADQIEVRAGRIAKAIIDRLGGILRKQLDEHDRKNLHAAIADEVINAMYRLGTFVCAGAQDSMGVHIEKFACNGQESKDTKITLIPVPGDTVNFLQLLAANAGKNAVLAFVNEIAYEQARDSLTKEIHREQTDWVHQAEKEHKAEQSAPDAPPPDTSLISLLERLVNLGVNPDLNAAEAWTEAEREVAMTWVVAYEKDGEACTIARPYWLPIPEPITTQEQASDANEQSNSGASATDGEQTAADAAAGPIDGQSGPAPADAGGAVPGGVGPGAVGAGGGSESPDGPAALGAGGAAG